MKIHITQEGKFIKLKQIWGDVNTVRLWVDCRDMGGHWYTNAECDRCGHDISE